MKVTRIVLAFLLALTVLNGLGLAALAQGPDGTWASGIQVQNNGTTTATVSIHFYWAMGEPLEGQEAAGSPHTVQIGPGLSEAIYVPSHVPGLPDDFVGSAVVEADQPVAAILNTTNVVSGPDPNRKGAASGILLPATMVYAPYARKNFYGRNSYAAVQNTSSSDANVTVSYYSVAGTEITAAEETATLSAYSSKIFYQDENANLPDGFYGSVVVSGTAPVALVLNNANEGSTAATSHFESYNGQSEGATKLYLPKLTVNYSGYQSSFTVQNIGAVAATMTVTYTFGGTNYTKTSGPIAANAPWSVYLATSPFGPLPGLSGPGSALITSDQPMVGIVTEVKSALGYSVITNAVPDGSGTDTVLFPKFDRKFANYKGGITIQNLGNVATTVRCTYSQPGLTDVVHDLGPIAPGAQAAIHSDNVPGLADGFHGSVVCVSLESQPIAGVYTSKNDVKVGDCYTAYNGIQK